MISKKPSTQKKCVKSLSLFCWRLPLHHSGHREEGKTDHPGIHDVHPQFQGAFASENYFRRGLMIAQANLAAWLCRVAGGRRKTKMPSSTEALQSPPLGQSRLL